MPKLQAAIFDLDGTLVDSVDLHTEAWQRAFRKFNREVSFLEIRSQIGKGGDQLLPSFFSLAELEDFGKKLEAERGRIFQGELIEKVRPFPRVKELFERIARDGLKIALASSAKKDELKHYVKLLDVDDLVDASTSTDDASKSKPHPDIFQAALKKLGGLDPAAAMAIGDTPYDAQSAGKAGLRTIGMLCGGFPKPDLRAAGAEAIFQDPADLLARYEESPLAPESRARSKERFS